MSLAALIHGFDFAPPFFSLRSIFRYATLHRRLLTQCVSSDLHSKGPMGTFKGFFRAPVTSNFTFILASDDNSQLWVGQNESTATQAIQFDSWCGHRDYSLNWEWKPYDYTPLGGIQKHSTRVSAPVRISRSIPTPAPTLLCHSSFSTIHRCGREAFFSRAPSSQSSLASHNCPLYADGAQRWTVSLPECFLLFRLRW